MNRDEIERARSALGSLDAGTDRETWVKIGMASKAAGLSFEDFHDWSATAGNYGSEADCRSVWSSITPGGIGAGSLFHEARAAGWTDDREPPTKRTQSRQERPQQPEQPKARPHDPSALWDAYGPATADHEYIIKKVGLPDDLRVYHGPLNISGTACNGALVLPCRTLAGDLASLQFITQSGQKLFLPGCKLPHDACLIVGGPPKAEGNTYIVEGIGQAWSAHQATRRPAVCCFGVGRMAGVAKALRERYPTVRLVLVADAGKADQCAAIAKSVSGGWVEMPAGSPRNFDLNDFHQAHDDLAAVRALLEGAKEHPQRFQLLTPADLAKRPPARWRVRGVLPLEGIAAIFGPSGSGKSFLVLDLLAAIAEGADWFGCRTKAAPVLYVALEGEAGIAQRVQAYQVKHGPVDPSFRFLLQSLDIRNPTDCADLVQAVRAAGWRDGVLCLDTLNRAAPGMDENDSKSMGEAIAAATAIQAELGGVVLLVHHTGKDAARGLRGHSSLHAALDAAVEVTRTDDRREWKIAKSKDGEDGEAHPFRLDVVQIGEDEDDEPVTSCVVVPDENAEDAVRRVKLPSGGNQRIVWDGLQDMFKAAGERRPAGVPEELPIGRPVLRLEDAIAKLRSRLAVESDRQTERTRQAITGLVTRGLLILREGWLWVA
ncbi:MAG: AAA family ATPase [Candidatus Accumulibacter phosphatis]|uniref:AAA family ATPase n=1 Tax=Candidatus Accumulibacter phosphatis TaxID=327160 RepID=UPI001A3C9306|nr:AAA family ATPase [Candidatus Accumulibacter phosphatis]